MICNFNDSMISDHLILSIERASRDDNDLRFILFEGNSSRNSAIEFTKIILNRLVLSFSRICVLPIKVNYAVYNKH